MKRIFLLLAGAALLAPAQSPAQSMEERIGSVRAKVAGQIQGMRPSPGAGQRLADALDGTRAALLSIEAGVRSNDKSIDAASALRDERRKLAAIDEAYQAEFARIESTLARASLTPAELDRKLAVWHGFTANYQKRMDASLGAFDRAGRGPASAGDIASLRAGLGERALPHSKPAAPPPIRPVELRPPASRAVPHDSSTDQPTPDDLAETSVVKLSPDIRTLAAGFGNSPAAIYAYVYNNIRWVPYFLAMQNSEAVLWSGRGSDADQSTLLIAMLRAAGIPARYVTAFINVPVADAINWVGAKDKTGAFNLLHWSSVVNDLDTQFQILHTYVEAWVDAGSGNGPAWIAMSPGMKHQTFQPGLQMPAPFFDRLQFLSAPNSRLATDVYSDQIHAVLARTYPGHDFTELAYTGTIVPAASGTLPVFLYTPTAIFNRQAALPSTAEWRTTVSLSDANSNQVYLSATFFLPDISLQSLSISYTAATPADEAVINTFGGIANVPAGMANMLAQFRLDDAVVATSSIPVGNLHPLLLTDAVTGPNDPSPRVTATYGTAVGEPGAIVLTGAQIGDTWIGSRVDRLLSEMPTARIDSILRETLFLSGVLHDQQMQQAWASVAAPLQYSADYSLQVPFGTHLLASLTVTPLFDRPFLATAQWFAMDDGILPPHPISLNAVTQASEVSVYQAMDAARSESECQTFERVALLASACTIDAMQIAGQQKIAILTITQATAGLLSTITPSLSPGMLSFAQSYLQSGATVTFTQHPVTLDNWVGYPSIVDWADISVVSFYGIDQLNGAYTIGALVSAGLATADGVAGDPTQTNGTSCSDPVTVSNGNMYQQQTDLAISSRGPMFQLTRTYNSLFAANNGAFGYGWAFTYGSYLRDNNFSVTYVNDSGGVYNFTMQGGAYVSPAGLDLTLTRDAQGFTLRTTHGAQSRFDLNGVLQSITDRNGNAITLSHDSSGRVTSVTDALNRVVNFGYDASNHIVSVQDFTGRQIAYTYDNFGDLTSVTDALGNRTAYAYYTDSVFFHLLQTVTKPAGNSTSFEYYVNRQTARISDSAGRNMRLLYLPFNHQTMFIDARGFATSFFYDSLGEVTRMVKVDGSYVDTAFTPDAKVASTTDEGGHAIQFTYDPEGNTTSIVDALGRTTTFAYEPNFNMLTSFTDALGKVTKYEYDASGNLVHAVQPLGVETRFAYDSFGEISSITNGEGNTYTIGYDGNGNPTTVTDALGNVTQFQFDPLRRMTGLADALGNASGFQFDAQDRLTQVTDPLGNSVAAAFDGNGNLAQTTDANGHATRFSFDQLDNLSQITDARAGITQYGYALPGCGCTSGSDLVSYRSAAGDTRSESYDFNHRVTQTADSSGSSTSFAYNARGDLIRRTDSNGNTIQYEYDAVGRLVHKIFPDGTDARFSYDAAGGQTGASNANTSLTFTYDDLNRLTSATDSRFGKTIQFTYNRNGQRTSLTDSEGGVFAYAYDANSRLTQLTSPAGATVQFSYDALNRVTGLTDSNGAGASHQYDAAGRLTALSFGGPAGSLRKSTRARRAVSGPGGASLLFAYAYDNAGNPVSITDSTGVNSYQFDELNRLTAATHPALNSETFSYDATGNRLTSSTDANYAYDPLGRLLSAEGAFYTYDRNGNLISRSGPNGTTTYAYDFENQLTGIQFPDGTSAAYQYDALGRRIQKNVNGSVTTYLYDGPNILLEMDANGAMQARYTHGPGVDAPMMMERGGQTYFYHADRAGSIAAVTDSSASTVCTYLYDSFGRTQPCQGVTNPFGFAGREYDAESGLYYQRARYYDPPTGRFLSADPLDVTGRLMSAQDRRSRLTFAPAVSSELTNAGGWAAPQQLNRYSYAANNPLTFRDPSGLACTLIKNIQQMTGDSFETNLQRALDQFAADNPVAAAKLRDYLANADVSDKDVSKARWTLVLNLNIALIGTTPPPPARPVAPPPTTPALFTPQETQQAQSFSDGMVKIFGLQNTTVPAQGAKTP